MTLDQARKFVLAGDIEALEIEFQKHQADFDTGKIDRDAYTAPYRAFLTTHPDAYETTRLWREGHPDSAQAMAARGIQVAYRAELTRGRTHPDNLSEPALETIGELAEKAVPLLKAALKAQENHIAAAAWLDLLGALSRQPDLRVAA